MKQQNRREKILAILQKVDSLSEAEIQEQLRALGYVVSKVTLLRDLQLLLERNIVEKKGKARATRYRLAGNEFLRAVAIDDYFQQGPDEREHVRERFDFHIFSKLQPSLFSPFSSEELQQIEKLNAVYQKNLAAMDSALIKREFERLTIELAWKSSQFEGNTYTLLETEMLLTKGEQAPGHTKEEATMIMNHKKALEYIRTHPEDFQKINLRDIENIHQLLMDNLPIASGLRERPVGIIGTRYRPLDNIHQIQEAMEKMCMLLNKTLNGFARAFFAFAMIAYIQPFADGNKRTSRLLANAILIAQHSCPLSYRNVRESEYKKAMLLFYEQHNLRPLKELFLAQIKFAVENYFLV